MSADDFIANAGLEWGGGPCRFERDIAASRASRGLSNNPIPPLEVSRLGQGRPYAVHPRDADCVNRPRVYSTAQRTRPFDRVGRPAGLPLDEGFNLDILTDAQTGRLRLGPDGALTGVPVYFAVERAQTPGVDLRIGYWMLYGRGYLDHGGAGAAHREGDWERVDALVDAGDRGRVHRLVGVRYRTDDGWRAPALTDMEFAGRAGTHPVLDAEPGTHALRVSGDCDGCTHWRTWRALRSVRREPWYGYGGAWGEAGEVAETDAGSGPLGPTPFEIGPPP